MSKIIDVFSEDRNVQVGIYIGLDLKNHRIVTELFGRDRNYRLMARRLIDSIFRHRSIFRGLK
jgi:hypothetical protein